MSIRSIVYLIILYYVVREFSGKGNVFLVKVIDVKYPRLISALLDRSHLVIECVHAVTAAFAYYHHRHRFRHVCQARARIAILQISITAKNSPMTCNTIIFPLTTITIISCKQK